MSSRYIDLFNDYEQERIVEVDELTITDQLLLESDINQIQFGQNQVTLNVDTSTNSIINVKPSGVFISDVVLTEGNQTINGEKTFNDTLNSETIRAETIDVKTLNSETLNSETLNSSTLNSETILATTSITTPLIITPSLNVQTITTDTLNSVTIRATSSNIDHMNGIDQIVDKLTVSEDAEIGNLNVSSDARVLYLQGNTSTFKIATASENLYTSLILPNDGASMVKIPPNGTTQTSTLNVDGVLSVNTIKPLSGPQITISGNVYLPGSGAVDGTSNNNIVIARNYLKTNSIIPYSGTQLSLGNIVTSKINVDNIQPNVSAYTTMGPIKSGSFESSGDITCVGTLKTNHISDISGGDINVHRAFKLINNNYQLYVPSKLNYYEEFSQTGILYWGTDVKNRLQYITKMNYWRIGNLVTISFGGARFTNNPYTHNVTPSGFDFSNFMIPDRFMYKTNLVDSAGWIEVNYHNGTSTPGIGIVPTRNVLYLNSFTVQNTDGTPISYLMQFYGTGNYLQLNPMSWSFVIN